MELSAATRDFIHDHWEANTKTLALQGKRFPQVDMAVALCQIQGRQTAKQKIPSWYAREEIRYPRHLSLEQCSSEATARYKASLFQGNTLTDLTGGLGIDCAFLAEHFREVHYVEQQPELCRLAIHNFSVLGLTQIAVHESDSIVYLKKNAACRYDLPRPGPPGRHGWKNGVALRLYARPYPDRRVATGKSQAGDDQTFSHAGYYTSPEGDLRSM